uniref:LAM_G_DOMAIN domain-containing protein n=1 Tax=Ascaris lumbricoides TaxID=6252 RepID=A0A0M3HPH3_ASCLU
MMKAILWSLVTLLQNGVLLYNTQQFHMQLPHAQAQAVWQLFVERNVGIELEVLQQKQPHMALFSVFSDGSPRELLFSIESSARTNQLFLKFRTRSGSIKTYTLSAPLSDGKWHRIIFSLSGDQIQLSENCHQLVRKLDFDLHFQ